MARYKFKEHYSELEKLQINEKNYLTNRQVILQEDLVIDGHFYLSQAENTIGSNSLFKDYYDLKIPTNYPESYRLGVVAQDKKETLLKTGGSDSLFVLVDTKTFKDFNRLKLDFFLCKKAVTKKVGHRTFYQGLVAVGGIHEVLITGEKILGLMGTKVPSESSSALKIYQDELNDLTKEELKERMYVTKDWSKMYVEEIFGITDLFQTAYEHYMKNLPIEQLREWNALQN